MKPIILPFVAVAALAFAAQSLVRTQPVLLATEPPSAPPVSPWAHTVAAVGLVETSTEDIAVGSPLGDVVVEVLVAVGQSVQRGDPLFRLDDRQRRAEVDARRAELGVAESRVRVAKAMLDDATRHVGFAERLTDKNAISVEEVTRRRSAVETATARVAEARAQTAAAAAWCGVAEAELERSVVCAPVAGDVLQVKVHPGEFAPAGVTDPPLVLIGRLQPLHVRVDVDEHEAWRVRPGARAVASVRGNAQLQAQLAFVRFEPFVLPKKSLTGDSTERVDTRVLQVIYRIDGGDLPLFVGQQMDVFVEGTEP
jgi:RND family efflux transporter MFP subunit